MSYDAALVFFGKALGQLKRSYAEEFGENINDLQIIIDPSNWVTIYSTNRFGDYLDCSRQWVDIDEE